ncbi:hypothetical protein FA95DRAFT_990331 [Auriscalpium vulgare]|uniref:Uncharacterized protein n=1 Tax=Auriscalpium vulgare TaxID=40419 RepID=A0ACB8R772_9AGAM|nr:hypothetical protein FA95DRAFT_990331 [Auriscalpium vulgare]
MLKILKIARRARIRWTPRTPCCHPTVTVHTGQNPLTRRGATLCDLSTLLQPCAAFCEDSPRSLLARRAWMAQLQGPGNQRIASRCASALSVGDALAASIPSVKSPERRHACSLTHTMSPYHVIAERAAAADDEPGATPAIDINWPSLVSMVGVNTAHAAPLAEVPTSQRT